MIQATKGRFSQLKWINTTWSKSASVKNYSGFSTTIWHRMAEIQTWKNHPKTWDQLDRLHLANQLFGAAFFSRSMEPSVSRSWGRTLTECSIDSSGGSWLFQWNLHASSWKKTQGRRMEEWKLWVNGLKLTKKNQRLKQLEIAKKKGQPIWNTGPVVGLMDQGENNKVENGPFRIPWWPTISCPKTCNNQLEDRPS